MVNGREGPQTFECVHGLHILGLEVYMKPRYGMLIYATILGVSQVELVNSKWLGW